MPAIPIVGIVGGIGSGKSSLAKWVAKRANVDVVDADRIGHEALQDPAVKRALCQQFGEVVLDVAGNIDRTAIAKLVFGSDETHLEARRALEQIVHPDIARRFAGLVDIAASNRRDAVLLDAPVLLEAGWKSKCDLLVFVDCPDEIRLKRVRDHRGWSEEELNRREASQWSLADKRGAAQLIVSNHGDLEFAGEQLIELLNANGILHKVRST